MIAQSLGSSMRSFDRVMQRSPCIYAAGSRLGFSPRSDEYRDLVGHLSSSYPSFMAALEECISGRLDGYVLELPGWAGEDVDALSASVHRALDWYASRTGQQDQISLDDLRDPTFWFQWGEHRLFVIAFGPCFDEGHPRYTYGCAETFVLFQHRLAFKRRHPDEIPISRRKLIRHRFAASGQYYDQDMGAVP